MEVHYFTQYLRLRLLIGFLGERSQFGWWPTSYVGPSSAMFLEPVFPKTARLAQYHGVVEAARRLHDEHIGVGSVFHLFRLPEEAEQGIHNVLLDSRESPEFFARLEDKEAALKALSDLAGGTRVASEGPTSIGSLKDVFTAPAVKVVAQHYLAAFGGSVRTYPYFMS
jgi:hypothetical protein